MTKQIHVTATKNGWKVKQPDNSKASAITTNKSEAIEKATNIAKNQGLEMIWHGKDGKIQGRNSYGNDPFPPKG
ncbi:MAG: DUF2188 domain-containing protein [Candidatus Gracilibacteria bacterium]|nr:DUF2188 domain-containing protein [Candidatus Gracilibacteria bacterium]